MPDQNSLEIWTVCFSPADYPRQFTARRSIVKSGGFTVLTDELIVKPTLGAVRAELLVKGLVRIARHEGDDPVIVETWI